MNEQKTPEKLDRLFEAGSNPLGPTTTFEGYFNAFL
jgi:hypothetical protein